MKYQFTRFVNCNWQWYLTHPHEFVKDVYREVRDFFVRGWRGYADSDVWGMDWYLATITLPMLKKIQSNKVGVPIEFTVVDKKEISMEEAEKTWNKVLQEMIDGYDAFIKQDDIVDIKEWKKLEKIRKQGFAQFSKYFGNLWD